MRCSTEPAVWRYMALFRIILEWLERYIPCGKCGSALLHFAKELIRRFGYWAMAWLPPSSRGRNRMMFLDILLGFSHTICYMVHTSDQIPQEKNMTRSQSRPWTGHDYSAFPRRSFGYGISIRIGWAGSWFHYSCFRINIQSLGENNTDS